MIYVELILGIILIIKGLYDAFASNKNKKIEDYRSKYGENGPKYYYVVNVILPVIMGVSLMLPGLIIPMMFH